MKRVFSTAIAAFLSFGITGCNTMYTPTTVNENRVQVREEAVFEDIAVYNVNDEYLAAVAAHYDRHGGTPMDLIVTYDPRSYRNTAMKATNKVSDIAGILRGYGVNNLKPGVLPVKGQGDEARLIVSYDAYSAHAPKDCPQQMPGLNGGSVENNTDYKLGCSVGTLMARQIARPSDLLGRGRSDTGSDGRSAANIVELYRTGAQNDLLEGQSASGE
ncbi:MAG: CpaD family pilus assembly lipoprotein [Alphaproteobacteria bacterium]